MFQIYDLDKSGFVTMDENLKMDKAFCEACGQDFDEESSRSNFSESDANKDGKVSLKEFLTYFKATAAKADVPADAQIGFVKQAVEMLRGKTSTTTSGLDEGLTEMFQIYDLDKSGFVTIDEMLQMDKALSAAFSQDFDEASCKASFTESDANKDGKVSLGEFLTYFRASAPALPEEQKIGFVKQTNELLKAAKAA